MNQIARSVVAVAAVSILSALLTPVAALSQPVRDVRVINSASEPVPIVGSVNVWNTNRTQMEFVFGNASFADGEMVLFTVPAGHKFVLTDAFFSHNVVDSAQVHGANVRRGLGDGSSQLLFRAFVEGNKNVIFHFQTGYEFGPGQQVRYQTGGSAIDGVHGSLVGYQTPQ